MGYRSEVSITIPNSAFQELVAKSKVENRDAYEFIKSGVIFQTDKFTTVNFKWIKWYEDYEEVQFIKGFIRSIPHVFNRIGEDYEDIENDVDNITDYGILDCVCIIRCLDVENAGELITIGEEGGEADGDRKQAV